MSNNKLFFYLLSLILFLVYGSLQAQTRTTSWRLIWDKNAAKDTVSYYVVYKRAGAVPAAGDSIARVNHPGSAAQSLVEYRDTNISAGVLYYYRVVAVDYLQRRSTFSETVSAAIPRIINFPDSLILPVDTTVTINLSTKVSDLDDASGTLSWFVNGQKTYQNGIASLRININSANQSSFITNQNWSDTLTLNFTVFDPDSFFNTRSLIVAYGAYITPPVDTTDTTDTTHTDSTDTTLTDQVYAFPIPFMSDQHIQITFEKIPENAELVIYNIMGESVFYYKNITGGQYNWDVRNMSGKKINSGLYIYLVRDKSGNNLASGKLVIIR